MIDQELLMQILKVWLACGLATFIHCMWFFRKEIIEDLISHPIASIVALSWVCFKCTILWPYIQYLNYFGDKSGKDGE